MTRVLALIVVALLAIIVLQGNHIASLKLAAQKTETAAVKAERDRALAISQEKDKLADENRTLAAQVQTLEGDSREAKHKLDGVIAAADARSVQHRAEVGRLTRDLQERARHAATDAEREASAAAIGVLADVYGRADKRAGVLAAEADRARLAGSTCEAQYDAVRERNQAWIRNGA